MANTITHNTITQEAAIKMIAAAQKKAEEIKRTMVFAVCDEAGHLKCFSRMDGAPLLSVQIAQDKAYTAISYGVATHQWFDFIKNDPPLLHGIVHTQRLVVFGGHWKEDMQCAEAGLAALGIGA